MSISNTSICNMALGKIGAKRINDFDDTSEDSTVAIQCRLHFEQTRDSLIRFHSWRFARARKTLSQDTVTPDFEWNFQYFLPNDFMLMRSIFEDKFSDSNFQNYALEDDLLLTNDEEMEIRYVKKVTDPAKFDPLFVEVLILQLALKLIGPLAGGAARLQKTLQEELKAIMPSVLAIDGQETNTAGRAESSTWNDARFGNTTGFPMRF